MSKYQELCSLLKFNQILRSFDKLVRCGPNPGPPRKFVRPAEQFCTSLVDDKQP